MDGERSSASGILIVVIVVMGYFLWQQSQQIQALNQSLIQANSNIDSLNEEITQANDDLDNLIGQIADAQDAAWSDYDTMGSTLENLEAVDDSFEVYDTVSSSTSE